MGQVTYREIPTDRLESKWTEIVSSIVLPEDWQQRIIELVGDADVRERILRAWKQVEEGLRRLKRMYRDMLVDDQEYEHTLKEMQGRLEALGIPDSPQLTDAGRFLENLGQIWSVATFAEPVEVTRVMVKALYVNVATGVIQAIEPQPAFRILFEEICTGFGVELR